MIQPLPLFVVGVALCALGSLLRRMPFPQRGLLMGAGTGLVLGVVARWIA